MIPFLFITPLYPPPLTNILNGSQVSQKNEINHRLGKDTTGELFLCKYYLLDSVPPS